MKTQFTLGEFTNSTGTKSIRVSGWIGRERVRKNFPADRMDEAITFKQNCERQMMNLEPLPTVTTRLTSEQAAEAESVFRKIGKHSLSALVDYALKNYQAAQTPQKLGEAFEKFMEFRRQQNLRPASLKTLTARLRRLVTACGEQTVDTVSHEILAALIFREGSGNENRDSDYRAFTNFFNWCKTQGYLAESPMVRVPKIDLDRPEPRRLNLAQCRSLVHAAASMHQGACLPYVALGLFCAIRPTEISRLSWQNVDLTDKTVTIGADIAKCRGRRIVAMPENAAGMLYGPALRQTPIFPANFRRLFDQVRGAAGLVEWPPDVLRHTGISMHYALHQHEGKTASWAGNSPSVIHEHYKGLVKPKEAAEFFDIQADEVKIMRAA